MHEIVTVIAKDFVIIPVIAYCFMVYLHRRNLKQVVIFSVISVVAAVLLAKLASSLHTDPRPFVRDGVTPYFTHAADNGFPSDHTTYSALLALIVLRYKRWLGAALLVVAVIIGSARVIAGVHHGQDIIAGLVIAVAATAIGLLATRYVWRPGAAKAKPQSED